MIYSMNLALLLHTKNKPSATACVMCCFNSRSEFDKKQLATLFQNEFFKTLDAAKLDVALGKKLNMNDVLHKVIRIVEIQMGVTGSLVQADMISSIVG